MNVGNSHTVGTGAPPQKDYPSQLQVLLNKKKNNHYRVINKGRVNVNTSYIKEHIDEWLIEYKPDMVFLMIGEPNHWNKYKFSTYLEKINEKDKNSLTSVLDRFRFLKIVQLSELIFNTDKDPGEFSNTFKDVEIEKSKKLLGYLWLGHLQRNAVYKASDLSALQAEEAIKALSYIYEKEHNYVASRVMAELYLEILKNPDKFLEFVQKSIDLNKNFNYELWNLLKSNALPVYPKIQSFVFEYHKKSSNNSLPIPLKEIEEWYVDSWSANRKELKFNSMADEIAYIHKLTFVNPSDFKLFESLARRNADPKILLEVAERVLVLNPLSTQTNILAVLKNKLSSHPEYHERFANLSKKIALLTENSKEEIFSNDDELEKKWIISDLEEIIKRIKSTGATVVVQTYPPFRKGNDRFADLVLKHWWQENPREDIKFMDTGSLLKDRFSEKNGGSKYYSTRFGNKDEHAGELGYFEIAKEMEKFIP